ncbi:NADH-quinone oxidoreductase subunit E [Roseivivax sp. CAU 1753]
MLRRLYHAQPDSFAFTPENQAWAETQITKFPAGRQASAIIPLLWRAQEQEGWLSRPAMEHIAEMLDLAYMRALEVATFYFMFQLQPVGSVAHIQVCGTTSCMICGAEDLIAVCKEKIAAKAHEVSADGKLSWEEVECLGACSNAPMAQIGKDYYEDLTAKRFGEILDELVSGGVPTPGPQNGRFASEPKSGLTSLKDPEDGRHEYNASVDLAVTIGDTIKRIDGTEVPLEAPWHDFSDEDGSAKPDRGTKKAEGQPVDSTGIDKREATAESTARPETSAPAKAAESASRAPAEATGSDVPEGGAPATVGEKPQQLDAPRDGKADDLKRIKGVGPKLEALLNDLGFYHFDQVAAWSEAEIAWVDEHLEGFKGRVERDDWVAQAKELS